MRQAWYWLSTFAIVASVSTAQAQSWSGMLNRLGNDAAQNVEGHLNDASNKAVDKAFQKTQDCVAGDPNCTQGSQGTNSQPAAATGSAKCVATDVACLKDAKAHGQTVEIVTEDEVDTIRCSSTDATCLQRAKQLGKKVEITD